MQGKFITVWRDELLQLSKTFNDDAVLSVEQAIVPFLGIQQYGDHINVIVNVEPQGGGDEGGRMEITRRSHEDQRQS